MSWAAILPGITGSLNLMAALAYLCTGDWKRALYWLCACLMTAMVTL